MTESALEKKKRRKVIRISIILMIVALPVSLLIGGIAFGEQTAFFIIGGILWLIILSAMVIALNRLAVNYTPELRASLYKSTLRKVIQIVSLAVFIYFAAKYKTVDNLMELRIINIDNFAAEIAEFSVWQILLVIGCVLFLMYILNKLFFAYADIVYLPPHLLLKIAFSGFRTFFILLIFPLAASAAIVFFSLTYTGIAVPFACFLGIIVLGIINLTSKRETNALWNDCFNS